MKSENRRCWESQYPTRGTATSARGSIRAISCVENLGMAINAERRPRIIRARKHDIGFVFHRPRPPVVAKDVRRLPITAATSPPTRPVAGRPSDEIAPNAHLLWLNNGIVACNAYFNPADVAQHCGIYTHWFEYPPRLARTLECRPSGYFTRWIDPGRLFFASRRRLAEHRLNPG